LLRQAIELTDAGSRELSARLNELAAMLAQQASVLADADGLRDAAALYRRAAAGAAARATDRAESLAGLGTALCELARRGEPGAVREAVGSLRSAISETPEDDPAQPARLAALAAALLLRSDLSQSRPELTEAAQLLELAAAQAPPDSPKRARYLTELGLTYERRYHLGRTPQDLFLAADAQRHASAAASAEQAGGIQEALARVQGTRGIRQEAAGA
jgi:hypothetical protein